MKKLLCLFCLLVFALIFTGDTVQQTNAQGNMKPKFQFKIDVRGNSKNPDLALETLVRTYIKRELNLLPDVEVVPLDAAGGYYFKVGIVGWEVTKGTDNGNVKTGLIALSYVTVAGVLESFVDHGLYTGPRNSLAEACTTIVGGIDMELDKIRK